MHHPTHKYFNAIFCSPGVAASFLPHRFEYIWIETIVELSNEQNRKNFQQIWREDWGCAHKYVFSNIQQRSSTRESFIMIENQSREGHGWNSRNW